MIGNFPAVLMNFNRLFLKLNQLIYIELPVLPNHSLRDYFSDYAQMTSSGSCSRSTYK